MLTKAQIAQMEEDLRLIARRIGVVGLILVILLILLLLGKI